MAEWLPAAISAAGAIGSTFLSTRQQKRNVEMTMEQRKELAAYQHDKNLEMWRAMQEYNKPAAQMRRFEEAGLNKHLIYGMGTPGNVQSFPEYQAPQVDFRGRPSAAAGAFKALSEGLSQYTGARQDMLEVESAKLRNIGQAWTNAITELNWSSKRRKERLESMLHNALTQEGNIQETKRLLRENWIAEMTAKEKQNLATQLENKFRQERNRLAERGITFGDSMYLRMGALILDELGVEVGTGLQQLGQ